MPPIDVHRCVIVIWVPYRWAGRSLRIAHAAPPSSSLLESARRPLTRPAFPLPPPVSVVRIDGKGFTKFTRAHGFSKPNDSEGLHLMNAAACAVMREFPFDIVLGFGQSDEYSFVFRRDSLIYKRRMSKLLSLVVSYFTGWYVRLWSAYFPGVELQWVPAFDGRCVLYPNERVLRDYLAWRQVDVHVNCQYNTCYWMLYREEIDKAGGGGGDGVEEIDVGVGKRVQGMLKGTMTSDKNEIMFQRGVNYNNLPPMWRKGSVCVWVEDGTDGTDGTGNEKKSGENEVGIREGATKRKKKRTLQVLHEDMIKDAFWARHPWVLSG